MTAVAVFTCHSSSHPFQERRIPLREPVKIGRSVAKARPTADNGIFDCKVLSRNHALIWYDHDTLKFYLQDTKSSNGTFINNQRLSRGAEESPAHELNSGDIIQFGVDVMENSRRGVVTHGCIVSQLTLFNSDGTEAVRSSPVPSLNINSTIPTSNNVPSQDLYQLSHYLKEALHREQMLEQKLAGLQRLLSSTQEASEGSWQALIDEDRLLSRLEVLESQLRAYSKANSEESIRKELVALQEDKHNYESTAKESLKRALEEKLEACRKLSDMERMLSNAEDECTHSKEEVDRLQTEQEALISKHSDTASELKEVAQKLAEAEKMHTDEVERLTIEKTELERKVDIASREEIALATRIEEMQAECDFAREQLSSVKVRYEEVQEQLHHFMKDREESEKKEGPEKEQEEDKNQKIIAENDVESRQIIPKGEPDSTDGKDNSIAKNGSKRLKEEDAEKDGEEEKTEKADGTENEAKVNGDSTPTDESSTTTFKGPVTQQSLEEQLEIYRDELASSETRLRESQEQVQHLRLNLTQAQLEAIESIAKVGDIEEKLRKSERIMEMKVEEATAELRAKLSQMEATDLERSIPGQVIEEPIFAKSEERHLSAAPPDTKNNLLNTMLPEQLAGLHNHVGDNTEAAETSLSETLHDDVSAHVEERLEYALQLSMKEIESLKGQLQASLTRQKTYEEQLEKLKRDLGEMQKRHERLVEENECLQEKLIDSQEEAREATDRAEDLQEQLDRVENSAKEVNDQVLELRDQLMEQQQSAKASMTEASHTKQVLSKEQEALKRQGSLLEKIQRQLSSVEEKSLQSEATMEDYQGNIQSLTAELAREKQERERLEKEASQSQHALKELQEQGQQMEAQKQGSKQSQPEEPSEVASTTAIVSENKALKAECGELKCKLAETEEKLAVTTRESNKLSQDINRLHILLREAEAQRESLSGLEFQRKKELKESAREAQQAKQQLMQALEENSRMADRVRDLEQEKNRLLTAKPDSVKQDNTIAANTGVQMKYVPVIVILIAIVAAVIQFLVALSSSV